MLLISETCPADGNKHTLRTDPWVGIQIDPEIRPLISDSLYAGPVLIESLLGRVFLKVAQFFRQAIKSCIGKKQGRKQSTLNKIHRSPKAHRLTCRWFAE